MNLNDLLLHKGIEPLHVLVLRHRPWEAQLHKVLPWLAAERPDLFNAYQQTQEERVEGAMSRAKHVTAFIGREPGKALFVGLYSIRGSKPISRREFWAIPANVELKALGMSGFTEEAPRSSCLWFDLELTDFYAHWKGRLIVGWSPPERSWWRWADRNEFPVLAVLEDSALDAAMPEWDAIDLTWEELAVLPARWQSVLSQWRGVYFIFDTADGKGYVGSAYGQANLLGRWQNYAARGDGGNRLLRQRDPVVSGSRSCSGFRPTWNPARSSGSKARGRSGFTRASHMASTTTSRANKSLRRTGHDFRFRTASRFFPRDSPRSVIVRGQIRRAR